MACTLANIPGFELAHSEELLIENQDKFIEILRRLLGEDDAQLFLANPQVKLYGTREAFPQRARSASYAALMPVYCVFDPVEEILCIAVNGVRHPRFLAQFIAEAGIVPFLNTKKTAKAIEIFEENCLKNAPMDPLLMQAILRYAIDSNNLDCKRHDITYHAFVQILIECGEKVFTRSKDSDDASEKLIRLAIDNIRSWAHKKKRSSLPVAETFEETTPCSLSAAVRIAPYTMPTPEELFGFRPRKAFSKPFENGFKRQVFPRSIGLEPIWAATPDDFMPINAPGKFRPLPDLSLRPLARLHARLWMPDRAGQLNIVRNYPADIVFEEANVGCLIPYINTEISHKLRITQADVSADLNWAVLTLQSQKSAKKIRALSAIWAITASRIKTHTDYDASLFFWADSVCKVADAPKKTSRTSDDAFPTRSINARFLSRDIAQTIVNKNFVVFQCRTVDGLMSAVVPEKSFCQADIQPGDRIQLHGFYILGDLEEDSSDFRYLKEFQNRWNRLSAKRFAFLHPFHYAGTSQFFYALTMRPRSPYFREKRLRLMRQAAQLGFAPAMMLLGRALLRKKKGFPVSRAKGFYLLGMAANRGLLQSFRFLSQSSFALENVPADVRSDFTLLLASEYNDGDAQFSLYQTLQNKSPQSASLLKNVTSISWLVHSVANGNPKAAYSLAKAHALGIGVVKNAELARFVLASAIRKGFEPARYWLAGFERLQENFFLLDEKQKEKEFQQFADAGLPAVQILLGLFYQYGSSSNPKAMLLAHALYSWVETTLHDDDAKHLRERVETQLTPEQKKQLPFFNLWEELQLQEPPRSIPLQLITTSLEPGPVIMHPTFLLELDPAVQEKPSTKLMQQIAFIAENSRPVRIGLAVEDDYEPDEKLRISGYGEPGGICSIHRSMLLVAATKMQAGDPWDVSSVYPIFEDGTPISAYLHGSCANTGHACGLIDVTPFSDTKGPTQTFPAFDPLWPSLHQRYRTNERYRAILYGTTSALRTGINPCDELPANVLEEINRLRSPTGTVQNIVGITAVDVSNALYQINSTIRSVDEDYTVVFSVPFVKIEVDSFLPKDYGPGNFVLYIPKARLNGKIPKPGDRIDAVFELSVCILASENAKKVTFN